MLLFVGASTICPAIDEYIGCKEPDLYPEEFVRGLHVSGVAPGLLELKVGAHYIIMRNLDQRNGVVNGTFIRCTALTTRQITGAVAFLLLTYDR